jgi:two-component system response regulator VicR
MKEKNYTMDLASIRAKPTVLVVDDEKTIRDVLEYNLRRESYRVLTSADGEEAIRLVHSEHPDLVILDIMLPGVSGLDVLRAIRREMTVPILMLSARETETDKVVGLELGADDYMTKPFSLREPDYKGRREKSKHERSRPRQHCHRPGKTLCNEQWAVGGVEAQGV